MKRAVLLDMGGVLLSLDNARGLPDSRHDWRGRQALARLLEERGGRLRREALDRQLFAPWREGYERRYERGREEPWTPHVERLSRSVGVEVPELDLLRAWFRPYGETLSPVPGARQAVERLAAEGRRLAICSNVPMPGSLYREILDAYGLAAPIESFHFSYDEGTRKPSPQMLRHALAALSVEPSDAVMVGDRSSDIAAGRAANTATVLLARDDVDPGKGPAADRTIASMEELPEAVASLDR